MKSPISPNHSRSFRTLGFLGLCVLATTNTLLDKTKLEGSDASLTMEGTVRAATATDNQPPVSGSQKKYFIVHLGPPKTATTTLQKDCLAWQDSFMLQDNYIYDGKPATEMLTWMNDFDCRNEINEWRITGDKDSPPACWTEFLGMLREGKDHNRFMSDENTGKHVRQSIDDSEWWVAVKEAVEEYGYHLIVIVAYRRVAEWLISSKTQQDQKTMGNHGQTFYQWPHNDGTRITPFFPEILMDKLVDPANGKVNKFGHSQSLWESVPDSIEKRKVDFHDPRSVSTKFFCDAFPDAIHMCQASLEADKEHKEEVRNAGSRDLYYDYLVLAAYDAGLIDTTKHPHRYEIYQAARRYHVKRLGQTDKDFAVNCPSAEELQMLFDASWKAEQEFMPGVYTKTQHQESFDKLVEKKKFCYIDAEATLRLSEWQDFFKGYA